MLQNATCLRKSAPGPPNSPDEHVSCIAPATEKCIFADPLQMSHACHRFWTCHQTLTFCLLLTRCTIPCACHAKRHLNVQKCSEPVSFLHFWLRNVLRATTPCTFSTSQLPNVRCLAFSLLQMCFAPRCAFLRHLNFQKCSEREVRLAFSLANVLQHASTACTFSTSQLPKSFRTWDFLVFSLANVCSEPGVLCTCWLGNVLCHTTACTFSTAQLQKVVRTWCALYILTWKCASRHNGVQFFISHLASWLRTRRYAALASLFFDPPEPQIMGETPIPFRAPESSFFSGFLFFYLRSSLLFSLSLPISAFHLSLLSEVWLLNFLRIVDPCLSPASGPKQIQMAHKVWFSYS